MGLTTEIFIAVYEEDGTCIDSAGYEADLGHLDAIRKELVRIPSKHLADLRQLLTELLDRTSADSTTLIEDVE